MNNCRDFTYSFFTKVPNIFISSLKYSRWSQNRHKTNWTSNCCSNTHAFNIWFELICNFNLPSLGFPTELIDTVTKTIPIRRYICQPHYRADCVEARSKMFPTHEQINFFFLRGTLKQRTEPLSKAAPQRNETLLSFPDWCSVLAGDKTSIKETVNTLEPSS